MDRELEQQIDELINKVTKDLKTKILRTVVKHQNKLLKDQARELKTGVSAQSAQSAQSARKVKTDSVSSNKNQLSSSKGKSTKKDNKYHNDSDTDGYYSE